jgi:copper(I)-binding protein
MRKLPQEIIAQVPYLRIKHSGMFVMLVGHKQFVDIEYFQQTCHCLEVIFEGEISTHAKRGSHTVVQKELHFRKAGTYRLNTSPDFKGLFFFIESTSYMIF